mgnify:CR=1 FL=1
MRNIPIMGFILPGDVVRNVGCISAQLQNRQYVRLDGVSQHQEILRSAFHGGKQFPIIGFFLVTHYLDVAEVVHQSRLPDFSSLVEQVSFGRQYQPVFSLQAEQHLFHPIQKRYGSLQKLLPQPDDSFTQCMLPSPPVIRQAVSIMLSIMLFKP